MFGLSLTSWIIIGAIVGAVIGWIASKAKGGDAQKGIGIYILLGIVGGVIGGWILSLL